MSLLSCLDVAVRRIGALVGTFTRQGGRLAVSFYKVEGMIGTVSRIDQRLTASATRVGAARCSFGLVCTTSIGDEDVLWASDGIVFNVLGQKIYITKK